jgi:ATP-dependent Clp protease ATP-binding subunit ClpA
MQVEECFKHELINKLTEIVMFEPLSHDELREIVRIQMKGVIATVADKGVSLFASDAALDVICSKSHNDVSTRYLNKPNTYLCSRLYILVTIYPWALAGVWLKAS